MTRLEAVDRVVVGLLGAAAVTGGLALLEWRYGWLDLFGTGALRVRPLVRLVDAGAWSWAASAVGVALLVVALRWALAHLRRSAVGSLRLGSSGPGGRLAVDLDSVADATAAQFAALAEVSSASGTTRHLRGRPVVCVTAHLTAGVPTSTADLATAAEACSRAVHAALPDGEASCRVLVHAPRRARLPRRRRTEVRIDESPSHSRRADTAAEPAGRPG